jgi:O6-methylguanine-DNA--protein-cysteine methyltransferase
MLEWRRFKAPGPVDCRIVASDAGIRAIEFHGQPEAASPEGISNPLLRQAVDQLRAYFAGELRDFDLALDL